ncbi:MAG: acetyl-CoA carboxylase biotin carboxyl carrier protein [Planctomycetia bacterium]|nr:acetyl-CoA carboxylase biotin carboxyl carrier protein [Planctomycetia bacterium]
MKPNETTSVGGDVFDVPKVRRLVQLMKDFDLSEMELKQGEMYISLKRGSMAPVCVAAPEMTVPAAVAPTAVVETAPAVDESHLQNITSPIVGTFYSKPNPTAKPFVNVGDMVNAEKTVCIIEAMKVMNQLPAGISGKIVAVLVKDGDAVEYGQPLFKVDTRG